MAKDLTVLVEKGELSAEAVERLKAAWVNNCDALYARMQTCVFSDKPEMRTAMENELGIKQGSLEGFMKYIQPYVSKEAINAQKPPEYATGALIPKQIPLV